MKKSKKLLMTLSLFSLVSTLSGCSKNSNPSTTSSITNSTTSSTSSVEPEVTPTFKYTVNDSNEITITSINDDTVTDLVIPDEIDGKKVVTVDLDKTSYSKNVKSIFFGKNVNSISIYSGLDLSNVEKLEVDENNEKYVSKNNCVLLKKLNVFGKKTLSLGCKTSIIPDGTNEGYEKIYIREYAFWMAHIESINIPANVDELDTTSFLPRYLKTITVDKNNTRYNDANGKNVIVNTANKSLTVTNQTGYIPDDEQICVKINNCFKNLDVETITIPNNITSIYMYYNFNNCPNLTTIKLGTGITDLDMCLSNKSGQGAFYNSPKLKNFDVSNNKYFKFENGILSRYVETKDTYTADDKLSVYFYCGDSDTVTLDEKYSQINSYAFWYNEKVKSVVLPTVSSFTLKKYAFSNSYLENIDLENCTAWGQNAFQECKNLKTVKVGPKLVFSDTTNGDSWYIFKGAVIEKLILPQDYSLNLARLDPSISAIANCYIKSIEFYKGTASSDNYVVIGNQVLTASLKTLCFIIGDESNIVVNENVQYINCLKVYNKNYESIKFPENLETISKLGSGTTGLKKLDLSNLKIIEKSAFYGTDLEEITLYEGLTTIKERAFQNSKLKSLVIPSTVTSIGNFIITDTPCEYLELKNKSLIFSENQFYESKVKTFKYHGTMIDFKKSFSTKAIFDKNFPKLETLQLLDSNGEFINYPLSDLTW